MRGPKSKSALSRSSKKRAQFLSAKISAHFSEQKAEKSAKNERERKLKKKSMRQLCSSELGTFGIFELFQ